jgi:hypothetical protein
MYAPLRDRNGNAKYIIGVSVYDYEVSALSPELPKQEEYFCL